MLGTAMGVAPGVVLTSVFGRQVRSFWHAPTREGVLILIGVAIVWIGVSVGLQRWLARKTKVSRG
jgi:phospholipase D1/2